MAWTRGPIIGRGATAEVSLATTPDGSLFAIKSTDLASSAPLQNEECLISQLSSPHIIRCLGSDVTHGGGKPVYNLFLEYSAGGSLSDLIRKQGGRLDEKMIQLYSHQLLLGIEYLHRNGLIHCDIKAQNILIGRDGVKIADFGCAKWAESGGVGAAAAFSGTPAYMAPEVARGEEQSFPADVWAVGCTVIEMATGTHPWPEMKDPTAALYRIAVSGDVPELPRWLSGDAKDFLGKCLMRDSKKRWTAAELLQHPYLGAVEEDCGEITRSPSSVIDQGFWDAVEVEVWEYSGNIPTEMAAVSPRRRMAALICDGGGPRWLSFEEEEEWVSVRSNQDLSQEIEAEVATVQQGISEDIKSPIAFACNNINATHSFLNNILMELFLHRRRFSLAFSKNIALI